MNKQHLLLIGLLLLQSCAISYQQPTPLPPERPVTSTPPVEPALRPPVSPPPAPTLPARQRPPANRLIADIQRKADQMIRQGHLQAAAQTMERGLRIAPKNAALWNRLAALRLRQGHYAQAVSLAAKSNSLARGDQLLIEHNQAIMEQAARAGR